VDAAADGSSVAAQRITPATASTALNPDSTLLDEGLPDVSKPDFGPSSSSGGGIIGHVIGAFDLPLATTVYNNKFGFDLDMSTGEITKAGFDVEYDAPHSTFGSSERYVSAILGTGSLNMNSLSFTISNFLAPKFREDATLNPAAAFGVLGPSATMSGSFLAPIDFNVSVSATLSPDYEVDPSSSPITDMPSIYSLQGSIKEKPLLDINGEFVIPGATAIYDNRFDFCLDSNDGRIFDPYVGIDYIDALGQSVHIDLQRGDGSLSGSSFSVTLLTGKAYYNGSPVAVSSGSFSGALNTANPEEGSLVVPSQSSGLTVVYGASTSLPTSFSVDHGDVKQAGTNPD
jgi:hypothetical protein